jgi:hypothetical protein
MRHRPAGHLVNGLAQGGAPADADRSRLAHLDDAVQEGRRSTTEHRMQQVLVGGGGDHHCLVQTEGLAQFAFQPHVFGKGRSEGDPHETGCQRLGQEFVDPASGEVHPLGDLRLGQPLDVVEPGSLHHQLAYVHSLPPPNVTHALHL